MTSEKLEFANGITRLIQKLNSFNIKGPTKKVLKLLVHEKQCGLLYETTASVLKDYPDVFLVSSDSVTIHSKYQTVDEITKAVGDVVRALKSRNLFSELNGWRNEEYAVKERFSSPQVLFRIERAAASLFGVVAYGSHINGYVRKEDVYYMWIARRANNKPTYPGMLDNFSAGGLTAGLTPRECAVKELEEEASVDAELASRVQLVDAIMYAYSKNDDSINREAEFVFDIELTIDFKPQPADGEVQEFYLMSIDEVKKAIITDDFKPNSAAVTLNFLMRKGLVTTDELPNYLEILENLHMPGY